MITTSIFPGRYVQGGGALSLLPEEIARLGSKGFAIVDPAVTSILESALSAEARTGLETALFQGECSNEEIQRLMAIAKTANAEAIVGLGGGKTLDTAKAVAHYMKLPVVIVPTLASTDAPCSALSVIYTPQGAFESYLLLPRNPDVVLVDSAVILNAPFRFLVSGMGDALSTWFEAEDCRISGATNMTGRLGSMTAYALARLCFDTLIADGVAAIEAVKSRTVTPAFDRIVEANTLLSGLGFESGGLSGAHAIHNGLTVLEETHKYWHGEKVAIGTLSLIMLTGKSPELTAQVFDFCQAVGLPIRLADIGLTDPTDAQLMRVAEAACAPGETIHNIKGGVTPQQVFEAIKAVDAEGRRRKNG